ncbi:MAG: hypothetical protein K0R09_1133 [Clostridiales bacterium]|jgi:uncharacterized membrane protein|nr:hypothetical protein [Clostridiales bacterium]
MNEEINIFIEDLKKHLIGLPEEEVSEAVNYYEEYLRESLEAGNSLEKVLSELGSPEKVADILRREANITRAKNHPGIKNFSRVIKDAFKSVSTPLSVFSLSITALISFGMIAIIFGGAAVFGIGAVAVMLLCIYQAFTIPFHFVLEIVGTLGIGLMVAGIISLVAYYLWICGKLFIRLSTKQIGLMLKLSGKTVTNPAKKESKRLWPVTRLLLVISAVGFILFGASGIPWRYFIIFNSMKPEGNITNVATEYNPSDINKISILTAHSIIRVEEGSSDKIVVSYEEPDWLTHEISNSGGVLDFREKSNGRLPLFALVSLHGSQTELSISLPKGIKTDSISLESIGGHIFISNITGNLEAKTLTGKIEYDTGNSENSILARTGSGKLLVNGTQIEKRVNGWKEYDKVVNVDNKIRLTSTSGSIIIE